MQLELKAHPARRRHHVRPRHARPGRGDDDGRPDRRHERRPDRAARHARPSSTNGRRQRSSRASSGSRTSSHGTVGGTDTVQLRRRHGGARRPPMRSPDEREVAVGIRPEKIQLGDGTAEPLDGQGRRAAPTSGCSTQYIVGHERRRAHRLRPERRDRGHGPPPGDSVTSAGARSDASSSTQEGGRRMTRPADASPTAGPRGAAGGAFLTVPACWPPAAAARSRRRAASSASVKQTLAKTLQLLELDALHRHERQDEHASVARRLQEEVRHPCQLQRGHQRQRGVLREDPGAALARPVDRPRHHRPHRQRPLPLADDREGLGREARQVGDPEHQEPRAAQSTRASTRTATTGCPGSPA